MEWLSEWFEPLAKRIVVRWPNEDPVQRYCDFLHHRLQMARERGHDVDNVEAFEAWMDAGGPGIPADASEIISLDTDDATSPRGVRAR
jgi:hypothetical protein